MSHRRPPKLHPRTEDRGHDRARTSRVRSRVCKRARAAMMEGQGKGGAWMMAREHEGKASGTAEPLTEELLRELRTAPDPMQFIDAHSITHRTLPAYLNELLEAKGLRRSDVVRAAGLNDTFGYQIFKGQRNPSRDKVLQLALALGCDLVETRRLLQAAGANELYCKDRRDAILIFCIDHALSLQQTNEELYRFGEPTLGPGSE